MSFETNPLKNKSEKKDNQLEKRLADSYESSDLKDKISILEGEIDYSKELLSTLEVEKENAKEDQDKKDLKNLKSQTLLEIQSQEKELEELLKEKTLKEKEETRGASIKESSVNYAEKMIKNIEDKIEKSKDEKAISKLKEIKDKIEKDLQKTKKELEEQLKD